MNDAQKIVGYVQGGVYVFGVISTDDTEFFAQIATNKRYDPHAVDHYRTTQRHDGFEEHRTKVRGESKDEAGRKRKDEREAIHYEAKYREDHEAVYKTVQQVIQEWKTEIARLRVGEYLLCDANGVQKIQGKMLPEAWPCNTERRTLEAIARIRNRPHYQKARLVQPLPPLPPVPKASTARASTGKPGSAARARQQSKRSTGRNGSK